MALHQIHQSDTLNMFFYCTHKLDGLLASKPNCALLVGSDFGYGNFGDIAQHIGAVAIIREGVNDVRVISIMSLAAISRQSSADFLEESYPSDGIIFASEQAITGSEMDTLGVVSLQRLHNVGCIYLYGGGFLNEDWGEYILGITEVFLDAFPNATYIISGQQISEGYALRVAEHVKKYAPRKLGVRDHFSGELLGKYGIGHQFSFDDAAETLLDLKGYVSFERGESMFIHLNTSDYTGNLDGFDGIGSQLGQMHAAHPGSGVTLLQAYRDVREEVIDTLETVKKLESSFPFLDVRLVPLVPLLFGSTRGEQFIKPLKGGFGYSCSYHVCLWLNLSGIPCWLRGSNAYYNQKRESLGIHNSFEEFLASPELVDYSSKLAARKEWREDLLRELKAVRATPSSAIISGSNGVASSVSFNFKGEPNLSSRLDVAWNSYVACKSELDTVQGSLSAATEAAQIEVSRMAADNEVLTARLHENSIRLEEHDKLVDKLGSTWAGLESEFIDFGGRLRSIDAAVSSTTSGLVEQLQDSIVRSDSSHQRAEGVCNQLGQALTRLNDQSVELGHHKTGLEDALRRLDEYLSNQHERDRLIELLSLRERELNSLKSSLHSYSSLVTELGSDVRILTKKLTEAETGWSSAIEGNLQLQSALNAERVASAGLDLEARTLALRLDAYIDQLAQVGSIARAERERADSADASLKVELNERYHWEGIAQSMRSSRSWRWTRPARVMIRFAGTGRFDSEGNIGLYAGLKQFSYFLPLPANVRTMLGRWLSQFRRLQ